jgi:predicted  nucleic acid-binding Zn-ribbon protein
MTGGGEVGERATSRGQHLLTLQETDDQITLLEKEIAALASALNRDPELERLRDEERAADAERQAAEERCRGVERELSGVRQRARSLERRLYDGSVRNPQDLLGMQRDLTALKPRLDQLEASLLECMEASESAETGVAVTRSAVAAREVERGSQEAPRRERLTLARTELDDQRAVRAAAVAATGAGDVRIYERVAAHWKPAVVHLRGDSCGGCHLPLGIREANQVRSGDGLVQCSKCDRVVVR